MRSENNAWDGNMGCDGIPHSKYIDPNYCPLLIRQYSFSRAPYLSPVSFYSD